jgi:hypothetical protein
MKLKHIIFFGLSILFTSKSSYGLGFKLNACSSFVLQDSILRDTLIRLEANSEKGFNFPYYLFIPKGTVKGQVHLLVETNNTGANDTLAYHDLLTKKQAGLKYLSNNISCRLRIPLLMPVFPRPFINWKVYTHALDRDAVLIDTGTWRRFDLQLIAMIEDATKNLTDLKIALKEKVLMNGFSASGTFANRFALIHPDRVAALATGGINAITILPIKSLEKRSLNYPIGINDFEKIFGYKPNLKIYKKIPQLIYMGEKDNNDAVLSDDAYSPEERQLIFETLGKEMIPRRWDKCKSILEAKHINANFKLFAEIGHGTNKKIHSEITEFFKNAMKGETE